MLLCTMHYSDIINTFLSLRKWAGNATLTFSSHPSQKLSCIKEAYCFICSSSILSFGPIRIFGVSVIQIWWLASLLIAPSELSVSDSILSLLSEEADNSQLLSTIHLAKGQGNEDFLQPCSIGKVETLEISSCFLKHCEKIDYRSILSKGRRDERNCY